MSTPLRVLIVEDSEDDAALLVRELRRGGYDPSFLRVDTAGGMKAALDSHLWDVIICDHSMPLFSAPAALSILQEAHLDLPFIIASGTIGEEAAVNAMKSGAHDYILKDNLARLIPAIDRELREAVVRKGRREGEWEQRRLHQVLVKERGDFEQRVKELTALNELFQVHLAQRSEAAQAYRELLMGLQKVVVDISSLVETAQSHAIPERELSTGLQKVVVDISSLLETAQSHAIPETEDATLQQS